MAVRAAYPSSAPLIVDYLAIDGGLLKLSVGANFPADEEVLFAMFSVFVCALFVY
jgi:hypothetical protein